MASNEFKPGDFVIIRNRFIAKVEEAADNYHFCFLCKSTIEDYIESGKVIHSLRTQYGKLNAANDLLDSSYFTRLLLDLSTGKPKLYTPEKQEVQHG